MNDEQRSLYEINTRVAGVDPNSGDARWYARAGNDGAEQGTSEGQGVGSISMSDATLGQVQAQGWFEAAEKDTEYTDPTPDREEPDDDGCRCTWTRMGNHEIQDITDCPLHDMAAQSQRELAVKQIADVVRSVLHESVPPEERREEDYFFALSRISDILSLEREEGRL
jgi:hypothetical protein